MQGAHHTIHLILKRCCLARSSQPYGDHTGARAPRARCYAVSTTLRAPLGQGQIDDPHTEQSSTTQDSMLAFHGLYG